MNKSIGRIAVFIILIIFLFILPILTKPKLTEEEYAWQVIDQFTKFTCSRSGICDRKKALAHLRNKWMTYAKHFEILEAEEKTP